MTDCLFCGIVAGKVPAERVFEDEHIVVFRDIQPKAAVHLLVIPRRHIASLAELDPAHDGLMSHMVRMLPVVARDQGLHKGFRTIINTGKGGGQVIDHLHIHLLGGDHLPGFE